MLVRCNVFDQSTANRPTSRSGALLQWLAVTIAANFAAVRPTSSSLQRISLQLSVLLR